MKSRVVGATSPWLALGMGVMTALVVAPAVAEEATSEEAEDAPEPCPEGLQRAGECVDGDVRYCHEGKEVRWIPCTSEGLECQLSSEAQLFVCLEPGAGLPPLPPSDGEACPSALDFRGACYGDRVLWCDGGTVASLDCGSVGATCGQGVDTAVRDCVDPFGGASPGEPCPAGLGETGHCFGELLRWCDEDGRVSALPCGVLGGVCAYDDDARRNECDFSSGPGPNPLQPAAPESCRAGTPGAGQAAATLGLWTLALVSTRRLRARVRA